MEFESDQKELHDATCDLGFTLVKPIMPAIYRISSHFLIIN